MEYTNSYGATLEVTETGKSFKTVVNYPATKRVEAETVIKRHRTYASVEKLIARSFTN